MELGKGKYLCMLFFEILFILVDIIFNMVADRPDLRYNPIILLIIYIAQDGLQLLALTVLCIEIFQTNVFKTGFISILLDRFKVTIFMAIFYFLLTLSLQTHVLVSRWDDPLKLEWPFTLIILYVLQRSFAVLHYYFYKRAALRLSDPRFYDDQWVKHALTREQAKK